MQNLCKSYVPPINCYAFYSLQIGCNPVEYAFHSLCEHLCSGWARIHNPKVGSSSLPPLPFISQVFKDLATSANCRPQAFYSSWRSFGGLYACFHLNTSTSPAFSESLWTASFMASGVAWLYLLTIFKLDWPRSAILTDSSTPLSARRVANV